MLSCVFSSLWLCVVAVCQMGLICPWATYSTRFTSDLYRYWIITAATYWGNFELTGRLSPNRQHWDSWPSNIKIIHISDGKILQKVHFRFGHYIAFNKYDTISLKRNMFYFLLVTRHLCFMLCWQSWDLEIVMYQIYESFNIICHSIFLREKKTWKISSVTKVLAK